MRGNQGIYVFSFWLHLSIVVFCLGRQGQSSRPSCGRNYNGREGKIKSPNYPNYYSPRANCLYKITVPTGMRVRAKFNNFSVEPAGGNPTTCYDYVEVHDGPTIHNSSLGKYCGKLQPFSVFSTTNVMLVRFVSDRSVNNKGFQLNFQAKPLSKSHQRTPLPVTTNAKTLPSTPVPTITTATPCLLNQFQCSDGSCIRKAWRCDGSFDCLDNSDEEKCPCKSFQMTCANGACVNKLWICDGADDCGDNSDEQNCNVPTAPSASLNCSLNNGGCEQKCEEIYVGQRKSISCSCRRGFNLLSDQKHCVDIDECQTNNGGCRHLCMNYPGGHTCACTKGYFLDRDKKNCRDIDECSNGNGGCNHDCINTAGSFHCRCYPGFEFKTSDKKICQDINECDGNNGGCSHDCVNQAGSFYCQCPPGYKLLNDSKTCVDVNECEISNGGCEHDCQNTLGSFFCSCRDGYIEDFVYPSKCMDIDECAMGVPACFDCHNTPGSYECTCDPGFVTNANKTRCEDIDECASNDGSCGEHPCVNSYGSYSCQCNSGYQFNPTTKSCEDIDECASNRGGCEQICKNSPGSYRCACRDGYKLRQKTRCLDIDECAEGAHQCQHNCTNSDGSYTCSCKKGYFLSNNGHSCSRKRNPQECGVAPLVGSSLPGRWHSEDQATWPWAALLHFSVFGDIEGCMATLIDKEWLITSAHCLYLEHKVIPKKFVKVELGAFSRGSSSHDPVLHDVSHIVIHKDFNADRKVLAGNIALVRLTKPINVTDEIRPICIPTRMEVEKLLKPGASSDGVVIGWGKTPEHRVRSTLHQAAVMVSHRSRCERWANNIAFDENTMICAGFKEVEKTACVGDSGSPLMFSVTTRDQSSTKWVLGGVMSWGLNVLPKGCHKDYRYTAYTSVERNLKWIKFRGNRGNTK
ncbi:unnamed protein product [Pocillopora meandrina]|uniref:Uncharacterized protein n=1 Tax=Pocillopora meandrina TaxID=46732 RepID=A0AAU9W6C2_9CNID|nr:unnamed protein product [Pocillopora meandrina]